MSDAATVRTIPNVLSIAGSDPGGGAGLQADLKTCAALEVNGCAVVTLLTAQNTRGVAGVHLPPAEFVALQLRTLLDDVAVDAVKIGALGSAGIVRAVAGVLRSHPAGPVVLDPVLRSGTGQVLLDRDGLDALRRELMPLATLVTPNVPEVGVLLGTDAPATRPEIREAARALHGLGAAQVLVTGGHLDDGAECVDILFDGIRFLEMRTPWVPTTGAHGTGCTLSSAIAAFLARGFTMADACREAQRFVAAAIAAGADLHAGSGRHPVHPLGALWRRAHGRTTALTEVS